jgi:signal transduction histidine kinase
MVGFKINDNGRGFSLKKIRREAVASQHLGLTTMSERVCLLGGDLKISSEMGQGTTVAFSIPIVAHNLEVKNFSEPASLPER